MLRHLRFLSRVAAFSLALAVLGSSAFAALPRGLAKATPIKRLQAMQALREPMREARERRERQRELRELARELRRSGKATLTRRGSRGKPEVLDEDLRTGRAPMATPARPVPIASLATGPATPNVRVNDTTGDLANETQSETSIAVWNNYMVAAWNDSKGWPFEHAQGWAVSTDGGLTWSDQGTLPAPVAPAGWRWASDPVVTVNPNTGAFYYAGLADASNNLNGIGVLKGRFSGGTFTWTTKAAARTENAGSFFLDKEWLDVDPGTGRVLLSYTTFTSGLDQIDFQSADSALASWSSPLKVSPDVEDGWVQGSRVAAGPGGAVYVVYRLIGPLDVDYLRFCRSTNGGASFSAPVDAVAYFTNFFTGAPGFNRDENNIPQFPGMAVDRSPGPHQGRVYLSWQESLNWYDDLAGLGASGDAVEAEPNNTAAQATTAAIGTTIRGVIENSSDFDYYRVTLNAGQHLLVEVDSVAATLDAFVRVVAANGVTRLTLMEGRTDLILGDTGPTHVWTAPADSTYYLRVSSKFGSGGYRLRTSLATRGPERGTDQRDVFVAHSDDGGAHWSTPVRVDDAPTGYDGWLPEVAVGPDGLVYYAWYDWRDAARGASGGESSTYLARSSDGGDTWTQLGATSDTLSNWTACLSALAPNQGDYLSLFASGSKLAVCWSDARGGTPDAYVSVWPLGPSSTTVTLVSASAVPGRVDLDWTASPPDSFRATLYRTIAGANAWSVLDTLVANPEGHVTYADTAVALGTTYTYRLGVIENGTEVFRGQVTVLVPSGLGLALRGVYPNPTDGSNAFLAFTLPFAEPATVEVFDLTGRLVDSRRLTGYAAASHVIPFTLWSSARSGVYLVRVTQRGRSLTSRVSIVR